MIDLNLSALRNAVVAGCCMVALASYGCEQKQPEEAAADTEEVNNKPDTTSNLTATAHNTAPTAPPPTTGAPAPSAPSPASEQQIAELSKPSGGPEGGMYTVKEGTKVDPKTLMGWKTWRALACDRCHGAEQQGLVGPPLTVSLHRITKEQFKKTLVEGRIEKGMPPFNASPMVMDNLENLYAYLKGRADAQIQPGRLSPLEATNSL
jgi:hypothetical protein